MLDVQPSLKSMNLIGLVFTFLCLPTSPAQDQWKLAMPTTSPVDGLVAQQAGSSRPTTQKPKQNNNLKQNNNSKPASGSKDALALARRVVAYAGGTKGLSGVDNMVWTYLGDGRMIRLFWDRKVSRVRIESLKLPNSSRTSVARPDVVIHDLAKHKDLMIHFAKPQKEVKGFVQPKISKRLGAMYWQNCSQRLLAPLKVLDPGVLLGIDAKKDGDPDAVQRLRVRFSGVGSAPADKSIYVMHVEKNTGRVVRMDRYRDAKAKRPGSMKFGDYQPIGRLRLSLSRNEILPAGFQRKPFSVHFLDVAVNVEPPKDPWTAEEHCLSKVGLEEPPKKSGKSPATQPGK